MNGPVLLKYDFEEVDFAKHPVSNHSFKDLTGKMFGFLSVLRLFGFRRGQKSEILFWECKCVCGNIRYCATSQLRKSRAISCGCKNYIGTHANQKYEPEEAAYRAKASNYKALAKKRNLVWDLSIETVIKLFKGNCFYCGAIPANKYTLLRNRRNKNLKLFPTTTEKHKIVLWNGIDRLDNSQGYIDGNCVSCCTDCNSGKMERSVEEFYKWIDRIVEQRRHNENSSNF